MAGSVNKVLLIGHVGQEPDIRDAGGQQVAHLTLATSESWQDKSTGERRERTEWHRITIWNEGLIKVVRDYVKKGSRLYVEGQLQTRKWQDKNGADHYTTEIVLKAYNGSITLLDSKRESDGSTSQSSSSSASRSTSRSGGDYASASGGGYGYAANSHQRPIDDDLPF